MDTINCILGVFYITMGFLISKFPNLLSGYNTLSDEEKESLKNTNYTLYLRNVFIICGLASIFLTFLSRSLVWDICISILPGLLIPILSVLRSPIRKQSSSKKTIYIVLFLIGAVCIFLFYGMRESDIEVSKERIENSGLYHFNIKMKDIDSITLVNQLPKFVLRTNGFDVGIIKKGFFKTEKGDVYKLSLRVNTKPYIKIYHSKNQILLLNYGDSIQTLQLFNNIKTHMK